MYDRDVQAVRTVGTLVLGVGLVLFILTALGTLLALFVGISSDTATFVRGLLAAILGLLMSVTLISCGGELQRLRTAGQANLENLRLVWTALFVMMFLAMIFAAYLIPPLAVLAGVVLLLTWAIRGAVIRLTRY